MKARFAQFCVSRLLSLYPRAWRERYAEEVMALLEECPPSLLTVFDLLVSLIDAHLNADLFTARTVVLRQRLRFSHFAIYCCALFFCCLFMLYMSQIFLFGDEWILYQREYSLTWWLLNNWVLLNCGAMSLLFFTFIASLVSIAKALKEVLTDRMRSVFFIWGFASVMSIAVFCYVVSQIVIPLGNSSGGVSESLAFMIMRLFDIGNALSLFGTQICIALAFAGVHEALKKWKEKHLWSAMLWVLAICLSLVLIVTTYRFAFTASSFAANPPSTYVQDVQGGKIVLGLLVFGWCFVTECCRRRRSEETTPPVRVSYVSLFPFAVITLFMNVLVIFMLFLTGGISTHIPDFGPRHALFFNSLTLFMIVVAFYTSLSLWKSFLDQRELTSLLALSPGEQSVL